MDLFAPASLSDFTNNLEVVPLTIESSTKTIDFPSIILESGLSFIFTPISFLLSRFYKCSPHISIFH